MKKDMWVFLSMILIYLFICGGWAYILSLFILYYSLPANPLLALLLFLVTIGWVIFARYRLAKSKAFF